MRKLIARIKDWWQRHSLNVTLIVLSFATLVAFLAPRIFIPIYSGQAGIQWSRFFGGTKVHKTYGEGIHVIFPWNQMYVYNMRLQQEEQVYDVLSSDGLAIEIVFAVRFKPIAKKLGLLHKFVGPNYVESLLLPELGAHARERVAQYEPESIYSSQRLVIQREILEQLRTETRVRPRHEQLLSVDFLHIEDAFIESITLPEEVADAIRDKLSQEQFVQEYDFILLREEKERERKKIEAEGIRMFQDIVNEGISEKYLKWKGIDATLALARSTNSKIVIIGAGEGGLPIILGNFDAAAGSEQSTDEGSTLPLSNSNPSFPRPEVLPTVPVSPRTPPGRQ